MNCSPGWCSVLPGLAEVVGGVGWEFFGEGDAAQAGEALQAVFEANGRPVVANEWAGVVDEIIRDIKAIRREPFFWHGADGVGNGFEWDFVVADTVG